MRRLIQSIIVVSLVVVALRFSAHVMTRSIQAPESGLQEGNISLPPEVAESSAGGAAWRAATLKRIAESDTYMPAMLLESDSLLRRWPERLNEPLQVYFEPTDVEGFRLETERAVRDAFSRWRRVAAIPVSFVFLRSPAGADVVVKWVKEFPMERAGQAEVLWQSNGLLQRGTLTLATHTHRGRLLSTNAVFTVALHEIGHLLGLGHSDDARDVMYPTTTVHDLTTRDRQTAMLLYGLPPGSLKGR